MAPFTLDVESLRTFVTVLDAGGMTRAAERLTLSQSAVSWKIKRLEERVGRELLIRDGRTLRPSADGEELLTYARLIIETHDEAVARLRTSELSGRIRFGTTEEVSALHVAPLLGRLNRVHPGLTIDIHVDRSVVLDRMVGDGDLDIAILQVENDRCRTDDLVLWSDELRWITGPECPYDEGTVPLVTFGDGGFYGQRARRLLREAGIATRIAFSGPSTASLIAAVEAGLGVAALSSRSVCGDVVPWEPAADLPDLPMICQVARAAPGKTSAVVRELLVDIEQVLADGEPPAEAG